MLQSLAHEKHLLRQTVQKIVALLLSLKTYQQQHSNRCGDKPLDTEYIWDILNCTSYKDLLDYLRHMYGKYELDKTKSCLQPFEIGARVHALKDNVHESIVHRNSFGISLQFLPILGKFDICIDHLCIGSISKLQDLNLSLL